MAILVRFTVNDERITVPVGQNWKIRLIETKSAPAKGKEVGVQVHYVINPVDTIVATSPPIGLDSNVHSIIFGAGIVAKVTTLMEKLHITAPLPDVMLPPASQVYVTHQSNIDISAIDFNSTWVIEETKV